MRTSRRLVVLIALLLVLIASVIAWLPLILASQPRPSQR
jgi:sensor domain CHASE-containing protein